MFQELKNYLGREPLLSKLQDREKLLLFLVVSKVVVSGVLMCLEEGRLGRLDGEFDIEYKVRSVIKR